MWRITTFTGTVLEVHRFINIRRRGDERPASGKQTLMAEVL